ncbi:MAG: site-specific DNA-methyltransferase, partial [Dehalococcoidia bacterium]|nr:site-specific DNA-methyltransferase [Dehalococcoidia bacterium]
IYIDPPYNTGNDFIYPDDYAETLQTYLEYTGQVDSDGRKFTTNTEADGRFHSKWLNMLYPRLYLARNLLREDGVIFVSIDDNEIDSLRKICNEVFGEENFTACIANVNNPKGRSDDKYFARAHEYLVVYRKGEASLRGWEPDERILKRYNKISADGRPYREIDLRKTGDNDRREDRPNLFYYFLYNPETGELTPTRDESTREGFISIRPLREDGSEGNWRWEIKASLERALVLVAKLMPVRKIWSVFEMDYLQPDERIKPTTAWTMKEVNSERGTEQFIALGFDKELFPRPKPVGLLGQILALAAAPHQTDIVMDFFAGSGTTGQAVLDLNHQDGGNRRFILVQLPEATGREDYPTIADICKERVRRVIKKLNDEDASKLALDGDKKQDRGFRVFKLAESNFKTWNADLPQGDVAALEEQLAMHVDHLIADRTAEDRLYELLLKSGFPLTTHVETLTLDGKTVYSVQGGAMLICLNKELSFEAIKAMAEMKPERVVCLDEGFAGNDQLKTNAVQTMKGKNIVFRTV